MASFVVHPKTGELVSKDEYLFDKYMSIADKQAMIGNQPVTMNYISDMMDPTRHMADGKYYTSKKAFRDATKRAGCIEIGNETKYLQKPRKIVKLDRRKRREDIKKAINDLKWGNVPKHPL